MTTIERTASPRFKSSFTQDELTHYYNPTEADMAFVENVAADDDQQLWNSLLPRLTRWKSATSPGSGKLLPSWLLQKLNTDSPKNKLYLAFRELGRVIHTMFLYIIWNWKVSTM